MVLRTLVPAQLRRPEGELGTIPSLTCREQLLGSVWPQQGTHSSESSDCFSTGPSIRLIVQKAKVRGPADALKMNMPTSSQIKATPFPSHTYSPPADRERQMGTLQVPTSGLSSADSLPASQISVFARAQKLGLATGEWWIRKPFLVI